MTRGTPRAFSVALALVVAAAPLAACSRPTATQEPRPRSGAAAAPPAVPALPPTRLPAPARLVAIGDLHGDLASTRLAFRTAGATDEAGRWTGGALVVVQTGDVLDRGDDEREILEWLGALAAEAARAGGAVHVLNGNHEIMNVQGDFRYVTPGGFDDFHHVAASAAVLRGRAGMLPEFARPRAAAFAPGGPYARLLARNNTVMVVGDTVFVHGGLLPAHVRFGLEAINQAVRAFMLGERPDLPAVLEGEDSPVWERRFALADDPETCGLLQRALDAAGARRLVIGHTVQRAGINSGCDGRVWRIDVGLARHYGGPVEVLEIAGGAPRVLRGRGPLVAN